VNAASFAAGVAPGGIATIFGANLTTAKSEDLQLTVNGIPSQVFYSDNRQVNFLVPSTASGAAAEITVKTPVGSTTVSVPMAQVAPGIFFDAASGFGAVLISGTGLTTSQRPAAAGDVLEIYATGLGPVQSAGGGLQATTLSPLVTVGGVPAKPLFSGLAPGFPGLYQLNVQVPAGISPGVNRLALSIGGGVSNEVKIQIK
jgi:uncharacterized protein (TIGR03437 family)